MQMQHLLFDGQQTPTYEPNPTALFIKQNENPREKPKFSRGFSFYRTVMSPSHIVSCWGYSLAAQGFSLEPVNTIDAIGSLLFIGSALSKRSVQIVILQPTS